MDYLSNFIIEAGKVSFATSDGNHWLMRQSTPEESADDDSAFRLAYNTVLNNVRLSELAEDEDALKREAAIRANAAEALYLIPLLLEREDGTPAFDVFDEESMAEFEGLDPAIIAEFTGVFWGPVQDAIREAKKKSMKVSSANSKSANRSVNGRSRESRNE